MTVAPEKGFDVGSMGAATQLRLGTVEGVMCETPRAAAMNAGFERVEMDLWRGAVGPAADRHADHRAVEFHPGAQRQCFTTVAVSGARSGSSDA